MNEYKYYRYILVINSKIYTINYLIIYYLEDYYWLTSCFKNSEGVKPVNFLKELLKADLE